MYRKDLKKFDEYQDEDLDIRVLPRYILSKDGEFFRSLYSLLDKGVDSPVA